MRSYRFIELLLALFLCANSSGCGTDSRTRLVTGRAMETGVAQFSRGIGSMPVNLVISPDGRYAITTASGFNERLCSLRIADGQLAGRIDFPRTVIDRSNGLYYGLVFGPDGKLYAAQGAARRIAVISLGAGGTLTAAGEIDAGPNDFPSGLAIDRRGFLYVTHNDPTAPRGAPLHAPASVSVFDTASRKEIGRYTFQDDRGLSNFPLAVAVNDAGSRLYVASQRDDAVYVLDASDPARMTPRATLTTGAHPVALLLNRDRSTLYVANAHSDTISIVDTATETITGTVLLRPQIARDLAGATPTALALSADERTLYASLGDMNAIAAVDLAEQGGPRVEGYIPAGWYPTAVAMVGGATAGGGRTSLLVSNAKGDLPRVPHDFSSGTDLTSPLYLLEGTLWRIPVPGKAQLAEFTKTCLENARLTPAYLEGHNPLESISRRAGVVEHVIYVVKENRSYDQVFGDLPRGNGDPQRCLFPREVTPNQHALAERFILLDNFYDSGDVSGDGWTWSTQAHANEYTVRNVPYQYSSRGRNYDYEGVNNDYPSGGFPALGPDGKPLSDDPRFAAGAKPVPDVAAAPGGHLWDMALRQGLTLRNYGFFVTDGLTADGKTIIPDNYPAVTGLQPGGRDLSGITDIDFRRFDMDYPDSDAPSLYARQTGDSAYLWPRRVYGNSAAPSRFSEWKHEFDLMLARDPSGRTVPQLMTVRFCTDHTTGATRGKPSPRCMVADNDFAVGQLVEAVSHSSIWKSCAIVIIEDDAQNGPDHVDAHRSTCLVISPWIKQAGVDHTFQNTVSAIRTIESLLNLPPMCQYDAASGVIGGWDDAPRNAGPYDAIMPPAEILRQRNSATAASQPTTQESTGHKSADALKSSADLADASEAMDFSKADRAPAELLNRIIWKSVRGLDSEMPPTPRTPGAAPRADDDN